MWYGVCDRERDKRQHLILKLICFYVGGEAERIGRFLRVSSASSQLCGGLHRVWGASEIHEITCFHSDGHNGFEKKIFLLILNRSFNNHSATFLPSSEERLSPTSLNKSNLSMLLRTGNFFKLTGGLRVGTGVRNSVVKEKWGTGIVLVW